MNLALVITLLVATIAVGELRHRNLTGVMQKCKECLSTGAGKLAKYFS